MKTKQSPKTNTLFISYLIHHLRVFVGSLGHLSRNPMATMMTCAVLAIALALPANMFIAINNISRMSSDWDQSTQISLYLYTHVDQSDAERLAARLRKNPEIKDVTVISKKQGLSKFTELSGFGDALKLLNDNPLPIVLTVQPVVDTNKPGSITHLVTLLKKHREVELAQLDMQWVKRLFSILELAQKSVLIVGALLALAVLLIIGNTIRLDIQNRREEIEVSKLIGASDAFIRRPFLYTGVWYGLAGGLLAWLLTSLSLYLLEDPVRELALLYNSDFKLSGLDLDNALTMISISCLLGLGGSWLAVGRHLSEIEPS